MSQKTVSLFLAVLMLFAFCGFSAAEGVTVTDMYGRMASFDAPVTRVVALTAADCEILCALGCEDALVGVGAYCDFPASILSLPVVNSGAETNIEEIIALAPEAVLMSDMAQSEAQEKALEDAGIRTIVSNADDIAGVYAAISMIGTLMGKTAEADALIDSMQETFDSVAASSADTGKTVYFEVSPLEWGLWTAGSGTFMDELAGMCGLTNVFADVEGWAAISEEQVIERNPDYIVTISMYYGEGPTPVDEILHRPGWENISAIANGAVLNADSNEISRPGPRLALAAEQLSAFVNEKADALLPAA